jgi:hypothetical protein
MSGFRANKHTVKAAIGFGASFVFLMIPAVGIFFDPQRKLLWLWVLLFFSTMPAVGWGAAHLARARGYPSGGGCGLCVVGYLVSGFLGTTSPNPVAFAVGVSFMISLPIVVLLVLPNKARHSHRRHHHRDKDLAGHEH